MYRKDIHIHFVGIGGIGMSGIAEIVKHRGYRVSGCDLSVEGPILNRLRKLKCLLHKGHSPDHVQDADVVVYSSAVDKNSSEVLAAVDRGIPVIPRALMLAELMRTKYSVAVAGSHGKTTTTSILSHLFIDAGEDPTVVIGGILKNISKNAQMGKGRLFIAEADESDRSLLYLNPTAALVTNIDAEHLDTYDGLEDVKATFRNFVERLPFYGSAFVGIDDANVKSIFPVPHVRTVYYGLAKKANVRGEIVELGAGFSRFNVFLKNCFGVGRKEQALGEIKINMAGEHNVKNSLGAISLGLEFGLAFSQMKKSFKSFKGIERRFEYKGLCKGAEVFDDYAHHPTELKNALAVARKRAKGKLHVVFQPHRFSRTAKLWDNFVTVLSQSGIDSLCMLDIYPASEKPQPGITSEKLCSVVSQKKKAIMSAQNFSVERAEEHILSVAKKGDLILTLGAGASVSWLSKKVAD